MGITERFFKSTRIIHTMLSMRFFIALIIVALFVTVFVLFNNRIIPQNTGSQSNSQVVVEAEQSEPARAEADGFVSTTTEPAAFQVPSQIDGASLLESHCSKCHVVQALEKFNKSRSEWELTLTQMETLGASLSEAESVVLLDYLTSVAKP